MSILAQKETIPPRYPNYEIVQTAYSISRFLYRSTRSTQLCKSSQIAKICLGRKSAPIVPTSTGCIQHGYSDDFFVSIPKQHAFFFQLHGFRGSLRPL